MKALSLALCALLCAGPVPAQTWFALEQDSETAFVGDWVATCGIDPEHACTARAVTGTRDGVAPGMVELLWGTWGDEGYSLRLLSTAAPAWITGDMVFDVDGQAMTLAEGADYFAPANEDDGPAHMIFVGEPMIVTELVDRMQAGDILNWNWGDGQLRVSLDGFAEIFAAVSAHRREKPDDGTDN